MSKAAAGFMPTQVSTETVGSNTVRQGGMLQRMCGVLNVTLKFFDMPPMEAGWGPVSTPQIWTP